MSFSLFQRDLILSMQERKRHDGSNIMSSMLRYLVPNVTLSRPYVPCESALQADVGFLIYIIY